MEEFSSREENFEQWRYNSDAWLDMQEKRNLSPYAYNESTALEIYQQIKAKYVAWLSAWDIESKLRLQNIK